ncbi:hypothetical protein [Halalkalibacter okhensis]|uniref:hypothetical protein n=1 Tax=Halalkalibacter okhensis TaxID=333138 RepID=UPI00068F926A|nr:hypothetical protein [Halalkalibacter okhensis]
MKRQQQQFQSWLEKHKFPTPPIIPLVVITNPSAVIRTSPAYQEAREKILHAEMVPSKLNYYHQIFQNEAMTLKQLNQLSRTVIKKHVPSHSDMLKQFALSIDDIRTGVQCLECHCLPMQRIRGYWICSHCHSKDKQAHLTTLNDYLLLISDTISNEQARTFLQITSASVASKLLTSLPLKPGMGKNRCYELSYFD